MKGDPSLRYTHYYGMFTLLMHELAHLLTPFIVAATNLDHNFSKLFKGEIKLPHTPPNTRTIFGYSVIPESGCLMERLWHGAPSFYYDLIPPYLSASKNMGFLMDLWLPPVFPEEEVKGQQEKVKQYMYWQLPAEELEAALAADRESHPSDSHPLPQAFDVGLQPSMLTAQPPAADEGRHLMEAKQQEPAAAAAVPDVVPDMRDLLQQPPHAGPFYEPQGQDRRDLIALYVKAERERPDQEAVVRGGLQMRPWEQVKHWPGYRLAAYDLPNSLSIPDKFIQRFEPFIASGGTAGDMVTVDIDGHAQQLSLLRHLSVWTLPPPKLRWIDMWKAIADRRANLLAIRQEYRRQEKKHAAPDLGQLGQVPDGEASVAQLPNQVAGNDDDSPLPWYHEDQSETVEQAEKGQRAKRANKAQQFQPLHNMSELLAQTAAAPPEE